MKNIWQGIACKFVIGAAALSLALFAGCGSDSSSGSDSGDDPVEESSSSGDVESSSDEGSSDSEDVEDSSSSENAKSSSSAKKGDSSSSKKQSINSSFSFGSSASKVKTKDPTVVEKTCSVVAHTGTEKALTATSENTIPTLGVDFHNEFSKKKAGTATYYTDGSFMLSWTDDAADGLARLQKSVKGSKTYSELGDIFVEYTAVLSGTATTSYVGASAYASSDDDLNTVSLYVVENYLDESEPLMSGNKMGEFDLGDGSYSIHMFLDQMVTMAGTQKNYSVFVVREEPRLCGYLDMTAIFDEVVSVGVPEVPLRWVAVSAEIQEGGSALIDMQEAKIGLDQGAAGDIDTSDAADEFCKVEHVHLEDDAKTVDLDAGSTSGSLPLTVDGVEYLLDVYASAEGLAMSYYDDGAFSMECSGKNEMDCEVDLYREFATPVLYTDAGRINVEYSFSKEGSNGVSIFGAHGYMETHDKKSKLEFFVLEDWLESFPLEMNFGEKKGELSIDGSSYEVYVSCSENASGKSCKLYSVRKNKRRCGSVNLTAQISQWESMGVEMSPLTKVSVVGLMVSGAAGTADFGYANISIEK